MVYDPIVDSPGTPAPPPPPSSPPPPVPPSSPAPVRPRGWWGRNWKWIVPTGCLSLFLLFCAFVAAITLTVFGAIKSTDAYKNAVGRAKADPRVTQAIGTPITEAWYVSGNTHVSGASGESELSIPIHGPKGNATIYVTAIKSAGEWRYSKLIVKIAASGQTIDLSDKEDESDESESQDDEDEA